MINSQEDLEATKELFTKLDILKYYSFAVLFGLNSFSHTKTRLLPFVQAYIVHWTDHTPLSRQCFLINILNICMTKDDNDLYLMYFSELEPLFLK